MAVANRWPARLWLVRHGQSAGNVALEKALADKTERIAIAGRDIDVPLSKLGEEQAEALGHWFAQQGAELRPEIILVSPYRRARHTAELIRAACGTGDDVTWVADERLREKEFGIVDRLTKFGIAALHPDQVEFRALLGKFYYRPPGGESWCDVILRLRSALDTLSLHYAGRRVLIVTHQVVILCFRYLLENLDEERLLAIDREADVANCSITEYQGVEEGLVLQRYNFTAPLERGGAAVTSERDAKAVSP